MTLPLTLLLDTRNPRRRANSRSQSLGFQGVDQLSRLASTERYVSSYFPSVDSAKPASKFRRCIVTADDRDGKPRWCFAQEAWAALSMADC
jgi:hypothetical protein